MTDQTPQPSEKQKVRLLQPVLKIVRSPKKSRKMQRPQSFLYLSQTKKKIPLRSLPLLKKLRQMLLTIKRRSSMKKQRSLLIRRRKLSKLRSQSKLMRRRQKRK